MAEDDALPLVSIIIPARNEGEHLARCIASLIEQDYSQSRVQVIVVDGKSVDNSRDVVRSFCEAHDNVLLLENPGVFTPMGLNLGIRNASGEIIIILGAHSFVHTGFIRENVDALAETDADAVGGILTSIGETYEAKTISLAMSSSFGVGDATFRCGGEEGYVDTVAFAAYRRSAFSSVGLFDEELIRDQDDEFNYRLRKSGGKILFKPSIKSFYYTRASLKKLWVQYFRYGFWKVRVLQKHPRMMRLRQFVPSFFVFSLALAGTGSFYSETSFFLLLLVVSSYVGASLLCSVILARRQGWKYLFLLPVAFATLHFGYGIGFLVGLVRFFGRWFQDDCPPPRLADQS